MHNNGFMKDPEFHTKASIKGGAKKNKRKGFGSWPKEKLEAMIKERDKKRREKMETSETM